MQDRVTKKIFSKDAAYQKLEVLKSNRNKRTKYREFIIEGVRNINEALKNGWCINSFIYPKEVQLSTWASGLLANTETKINFALKNSLMEELSGKADTSELMAVVRMNGLPEPADLQKSISDLPELPVLVLFDRPSNKGNLGTLLRSCDALGADRLIINGHGVDIYDPDVIASSTGSFFKLPFLRLSDNKDIGKYIAGLKQRYPKMLVAGTAEKSGKPIYDIDLRVPVLIMIGNEKSGLNRHLQGLCDVMAEIPMNAGRAASSLNVSCAATVILYEINRQRIIP